MTDKEASDIYSMFPKEKRDMPREEFIKELKAALDPVKAQQDLEAIRIRKQIGL